MTRTLAPDTMEQGLVIDYGPAINREIHQLLAEIGHTLGVRERFPNRWLAVKLLEADEEVRASVRALPGGPVLLAAAEEGTARLEESLEEDLDTLIAERRYAWIHEVVESVSVRPVGETLSASDRLDRVLTHRWLGLPFFLFVMWAVFKLTADVSAPYLDWVDGVIGGPITNWTTALLSALGLGGTWVASLFVDGVLAGVGGVLVFVPVLMSLYFALAILEESGYMARAAFVMDRFMRFIGLHGKSFLPMMVGFGCTVPAIYATRTLENEKDRILTGLLVPFMSCGARLPVYVLFATIFFPRSSGMVVFSMYLIGIATAILLGLLLKRTLFRRTEPSHFVLELPPYRTPSARSVWAYIWERTGAFVRSAWTLIMAVSVVIWLLLAVPAADGGDFADVAVEDSLFGAVSEWISPAFEPLGFGDWEASGSLITGFVAKEVVVATMAQVYGAEDAAVVPAETPGFTADLAEIGTSFMHATLDTLRAIPLIVGVDLFDQAPDEDLSVQMLAVRTRFEEMSGGHGALAAYAFMVFVLLYTPCMVAVAAERQELGVRWMWFSVIGQLAIAWIAALTVFQGGLLLGIG